MLGVVTGLTAEARVAAGLGRAFAGGGFPAGAALMATRLADEGATALVSFGLAGGLSAALRPGAIVIPDTIVTVRDRYTAHPALAAWLGGGTGMLFATDAVAATALEKQGLQRRFGADAVDMESGAVAEVARTRGLPFAALRAICDPAETDLPPAALATLDSRGGIGVARLMGSLLSHPGQVPALLRLARQAAQARAALIARVAVLASQAAFVPA